MGVADPGSIVWDEIVAFWMVLWLAMPMGFWGQLAAFALFRYFDAAKPGPWPGPTRSRALAGAAAGAFCLTTWWPPSARCWCRRCGATFRVSPMTLSKHELQLMDKALQADLTIFQQLLARGWMLATAESCTGGMIAAACTDLAGSSQWFERGL
jgi:hypothetical protein